MSPGAGAGVRTVTGTAAVGVDVAVVDAIGTVGAVGSPGGARTGGLAGVARTGVAVGRAGATARGAGAGAGGITVGAGAAMTSTYTGTGIYKHRGGSADAFTCVSRRRPIKFIPQTLRLSRLRTPEKLNIRKLVEGTCGGVRTGWRSCLSR